MTRTCAFAVLLVAFPFGTSASNASAPINACVCCNYGAGYRRSSEWCSGSAECDGDLGGWCACTNPGCQMPPKEILTPVAIWRQVGSINTGDFTFYYEKGISYTSTKEISHDTSSTLSTSVSEKATFAADGVTGSAGVSVSTEEKRSWSDTITNSHGQYQKQGCKIEPPKPPAKQSETGWNVFQWTITGTEGVQGGDSGERVMFSTCDHLILPKPLKPKCSLDDCADVECQKCLRTRSTPAVKDSSLGELTGRGSHAAPPMDSNALFHTDSNVNSSDPIDACVCCSQGGGYRRRSSWCHGDGRCNKLGGWCACTNHNGKGCVAPDPVVGKAEAGWQRVGSLNQGTFTDTFEMGTSTTSGKEVTEGESRSLSTSVEGGLEFPGMSVSAKVTSTYQQSVSSSVSLSGTKSDKTACSVTYVKNDPSITGVEIFQWHVSAANNDAMLSVKTCDFLVIPKPLQPKCPVGCCQDLYCQKCMSECSSASSVTIV